MATYFFTKRGMKSLKKKTSKGGFQFPIGQGMFSNSQKNENDSFGVLRV
jgi:hypothetical protein